ncbi:MAG: hypothetical protein ACYTFQ_24400, partial [Planctomycetota bacterium]
MKKLTRPSHTLLTAITLTVLLASFTCSADAADKLNTPPEGFKALFNGKDLTGWKGLLKRPYDNPIKRALAPDKLKELQKEADENMRAHWSVVDGVLVFDGG